MRLYWSRVIFLQQKMKKNCHIYTVSHLILYCTTTSWLPSLPQLHPYEQFGWGAMATAGEKSTKDSSLQLRLSLDSTVTNFFLLSVKVKQWTIICTVGSPTVYVRIRFSVKFMFMFFNFSISRFWPILVCIPFLFTVGCGKYAKNNYSMPKLEDKKSLLKL